MQAQYHVTSAGLTRYYVCTALEMCSGVVCVPAPEIIIPYIAQGKSALPYPKLEVICGRAVLCSVSFKVVRDGLQGPSALGEGMSGSLLPSSCWLSPDLCMYIIILLLITITLVSSLCYVEFSYLSA